MKNRVYRRSGAAAEANPALRGWRFGANVGDRLLQVTTRALLRFAEVIERTFGLSPEATADALKSFIGQSRVVIPARKPAPARRVPARPEQAMAGQRK